MKRVFFYSTVLLLLFTTCDKTPKDVKPIDWENYNDVYTVFWNCYSSCKEIKSEYVDKTIKISGWKVQSADLFVLGDDAKCAETFFAPAPSTVIAINFYFPGSDAFLDTCDLTKKCFIKGKIRLPMGKFSSGCFIEPTVGVMDINDIYFE